MQADPSHSPPSRVEGSVVGLRRYPVKSMMGEELNAAEVTDRGLVGDRQFAVVDASTGKVAGAKNPRKWGNFFDFRAAYVEPPERGSMLPAVRLTLPDGTVVTSEQPDVAQVLSRALGREVAFAEAGHGGESSGAQAEEYWPDMEGLDYRDTVTEWELPAGTFFDLAVVHLLTTATIERLRALYPEGRFEVRRFRPNIVVATGSDQQGFVENDWIGHTVAIGDEVRLRITGPCPRCVMTTLPQGDLPKDAGILRTAAQNNQANVGVYADVVRGGTVRRSDDVTVAQARRASLGVDLLPRKEAVGVRNLGLGSDITGLQVCPGIPQGKGCLGFERSFARTLKLRVRPSRFTPDAVRRQAHGGTGARLAGASSEWRSEDCATLPPAASAADDRGRAPESNFHLQTRHDRVCASHAYQLDPLMAKAMDQNLLPVLLTRRYLYSPAVAVSGAFWPGREIVEADSAMQDCDILLAQEDSVIVCECKQSASGLSMAQAEKPLALAELSGAVTYFARQQRTDGRWGPHCQASAPAKGTCSPSRKRGRSR